MDDEVRDDGMMLIKKQKMSGELWVQKRMESQGVCKNVTGDRGGSETLGFGCNFS